MLRGKLQQDQIQALKSGDKDRLNALRYLMSKIKNQEIEKKSELDDPEVVEILRKQVKELKESIEAFAKANRQELLEESKKQLTIISAYLPQELTDEELKKEIEKIINENKELYEKNPKVIIGLAIKLLKEKAEPTRIVKVLQTLMG